MKLHPGGMKVYYFSYDLLKTALIMRQWIIVACTVCLLKSWNNTFLYTVAGTARLQRKHGLLGSWFGNLKMFNLLICVSNHPPVTHDAFNDALLPHNSTKQHAGDWLAAVSCRRRENSVTTVYQPKSHTFLLTCRNRLFGHSWGRGTRGPILTIQYLHSSFIWKHALFFFPTEKVQHWVLLLVVFLVLFLLPSHSCGENRVLLFSCYVLPCSLASQWLWLSRNCFLRRRKQLPAVTAVREWEAWTKIKAR